LVAKLLAHPIPKCNQNIKYDITILERHGFYINSVFHDTMIKAGLLYPELPKALDFLTSIYTPLKYYKDEGKNFDPTKDDKERILIYNAKDSLAAHLVNKKQEEELKENGSHELYYKELSPLILIYKDIDEARILIDQNQKEKLLLKYTDAYNRELTFLRNRINNDKFNARSPQQVGRLIYDDLKFPKRQKTNEYGEKTYKTDKDTLDELIINHPEDNRLGNLGYGIITRVILCRKLAKVIEYIETP